MYTMWRSEKKKQQQNLKQTLLMANDDWNKKKTTTKFETKIYRYHTMIDNLKHVSLIN